MFAVVGNVLREELMHETLESTRDRPAGLWLAAQHMMHHFQHISPAWGFAFALHVIMSGNSRAFLPEG